METCVPSLSWRSPDQGLWVGPAQHLYWPLPLVITRLDHIPVHMPHLETKGDNVSDDVARFVMDEEKAGALIEELRWSNGITCPYCCHRKLYETRGPNPVRKQWKCARCRRKFSVTTGSILDGSHLALGKWVHAVSLLCSSKEGVSIGRLKRELSVSDRSARFLVRRLRDAMRQEPIASMLPSTSWSEKSVSLYPLLVREALTALLKVRRRADRTKRGGRRTTATKRDSDEPD